MMKERFLRNVTRGIGEIVKKRRGEGPSGSPEEGKGGIDGGEMRRVDQDTIDGWF